MAQQQKRVPGLRRMRKRLLQQGGTRREQIARGPWRTMAQQNVRPLIHREAERTRQAAEIRDIRRAQPLRGIQKRACARIRAPGFLSFGVANLIFLAVAAHGPAGIGAGRLARQGEHALGIRAIGHKIPQKGHGIHAHALRIGQNGFQRVGIAMHIRDDRQTHI